MRCLACGEELEEGAHFCSVCGAAVPEDIPKGDASPSEHEVLLAALKEALEATGYYQVEYGHDTDLVISSISSDRLEAEGMSHVEYAAVLKALKAEHVVYLWESLKESSGGVTFGGIESDLHTAEEIRSSVRIGDSLMPEHEVGFESQAAGWDYRVTQDLLTKVVNEQGWGISTVLRREGAMW